MTRILQLLSIILGLSLSAPDTASSQTSKGGSVPPSPAAVAISDFDSNCGGCHPIPSLQDRTASDPGCLALSAEDPARQRAMYTHPRMSTPAPRVSPGPQAIFSAFLLTYSV